MSNNILSHIVARKRQLLAKLCAQNDVIAWQEQAVAFRERADPHRLRCALEADSPVLKIIAEFKRRSPSRGMIRSDLSPTDATGCYARGGACAISILTDEEYFGGSLADLIAIRDTTPLPILRKDFIIDPIQVYEAAAAGADAILLIAAILDDPLLTEMRIIAEDDLRLDALVEVHSSEELRRAVNAGAKLIGINNRNLRTFETSVQTSEMLIAEMPGDAVVISESGLQSADQLHRLHTLGFRGFLIGETLMRASDPETALRSLIQTFSHLEAKSS